jgi:hypothetical protein
MAFENSNIPSLGQLRQTRARPRLRQQRCGCSTLAGASVNWDTEINVARPVFIRLAYAIARPHRIRDRGLLSFNFIAFKAMRHCSTSRRDHLIHGCIFRRISRQRPNPSCRRADPSRHSSRSRALRKGPKPSRRGRIGALFSVLVRTS